MKKILVPTDFSDSSLKAAIYAAELASASASCLILLHVYQLNTVVSEPSLLYIINEETRTKEFERIRRWANKIKKAASEPLSIYYEAKKGDTAKEIAKAATEHEAYLIVMGVRGAGNVLRTLFGSTTTAMIKITDRPLLVVPDHLTFQPVKQIVYATDYLGTTRKEHIALLADLARTFGAKLSLLHIKFQEVSPDTGAWQNTEADKIISQLERAHIKPELNFLEAIDILEGIKAYIQEVNADLLVMSPHAHGFFHRLFHSSISERMAFETELPLLTLPAS